MYWLIGGALGNGMELSNRIHAPSKFLYAVLCCTLCHFVAYCPPDYSSPRAPSPPARVFCQASSVPYSQYPRPHSSNPLLSFPRLFAVSTVLYLIGLLAFIPAHAGCQSQSWPPPWQRKGSSYFINFIIGPDLTDKESWHAWLNSNHLKSQCPSKPKHPKRRDYLHQNPSPRSFSLPPTLRPPPPLLRTRPHSFIRGGAPTTRHSMHSHRQREYRNIWLVC
ncbi:hypothetical protein GGS20DRAFT_196816 [Poronia punctata]|nr:hypothetical protein GGS20DRAFT_196816 [Poronia punctata]